MTFTPAQDIPVSVRRKAAAIHEAGHALVAIVLGRKVTGAMLRQPQGLSGETQFEDEPGVWLDLKVQANRQIVENAIVTLMAGQIAEAEYWKKLTSLYNPLVDSHWHDVVEINRMKACFSFSSEQNADFLAHCAGNAKHIVLHNDSQTAIEEIATKLSNDFLISRVELDEILMKFKVISERQ